MALTLPGLASNLDTAEIIKALMDVQSIPRSLLSAKRDDKNVIISQLQTLNTSIGELATRAAALAKPDGLALFTGRSSSDAVTVAAGAGATAMSADVVVDRTAQAHTVVTGAVTAWPDDSPVLTLENAAGVRVQVAAASASLQDVARAISSAAFGVAATAVPVQSGGTTMYRLQLTATETGAAGAFTVYRGDIAAVEAGTAVDVSSEAGAAVITTGADAQLRLWAGTAAEQVVSSATNTFTGLFPGVDVTVAKASATAVQITVDTDAGGRTKAAGDFITGIASILTRIANGSKATIAATPGSATTLGVFTGDSTVRALRQALAESVQHPVDGVSPSTIGISIDRYGVLSFDAEKFEAALAEDPAATTALVSAVASRVQETAKTYSDRYEGLLTSRITGQESEVKAIGEQLERWDVRLEQRRATLERTYARLETMLSQLNSQSSYLESQLATLRPSGSSS
jgi:flagellar hook-associated protein 2